MSSTVGGKSPVSASSASFTSSSVIVEKTPTMSDSFLSSRIAMLGVIAFAPSAPTIACDIVCAA